MPDKTRGEKRGDKRRPTEPRRTVLDDNKTEEMLAILIRNESAFEVVADMLQVEHLERLSDHHALVWRVVKAYHKKYGALPARANVMADMHNACRENEDLLDEDGLLEADKFIDYAFDDKEHGKLVTKPNSPPARSAIDTCRRFLEEAVALKFRDALLQNDTMPEDVQALLDSSRTQLDLVGSLTDVPIDVPFPEDWDKRRHVKLFTTGVQPLDSFMGGGWRAGEVVLFMGPFGSCKTTVTCNGVAESIYHAQDIYATGKCRKRKGKRLVPVVVLIFTEGDKDEYRCRLMANLARVQWKRLAQMEKLTDLGDGDEPGATKETRYERAEFKQDDDEAELAFENEQTRVRNAAALANRHLIMIDCTDSDDSPHQVGRGGIPEIANIVRSVMQKRKNAYPLCFWLDHVSALADRIVETDAEAEDKLHLVLKRIPRQAADKLAKPWKAPIALMHQLSGEANQRKSTAKFHHADAAGSKSIAEYVNFAVVTGPVDDSGLCKWECTKHRREPPQKYRVVKIEGDFSRVRESNDHTIDFGRNMIVSKEDMKVYQKAAGRQRVDYESSGEF